MTSDKARDAAERVVAVCDILAAFVGDDPEAFIGDVHSPWAVEMGLIRIGEDVNCIPREML